MSDSSVPEKKTSEQIDETVLGAADETVLGGAGDPPTDAINETEDQKKPEQSVASSAAPATATPKGLPEVFGRYRIKKKLGQGAMGAVYLAHDTQLDRQVALKVPFFNPEDGQEVIDRFYREARSMATLRHANLCPVHDVGEIDGVHYLTMAFIKGHPLADYLKKEKPLPGKQVAAVVRKLALALEAAHKEGIVHRDLKPANIMIDEDNEPIVMDFGLAQRRKENEKELTQSGAILGSPAYMSPEQVEADQDKIGPCSDVYALGVITYRMICGKLPFEGSMASVLGKILMQPPAPPSEIHGKTDKALEAICLKAMSKKVEDRYKSARAMASDLGKFLKGQRPGAVSAVDDVVDQDLEPLGAVQPQPIAPGEGSVSVSEQSTDRLANELFDDLVTAEQSSGSLQPASILPTASSSSLLPPQPAAAGNLKTKLSKMPKWVWGVAGGGVALVLIIVIVAMATSGGDPETVANSDTKADGTQTQQPSTPSPSQKTEPDERADVTPSPDVTPPKAVREGEVLTISAHTDITSSVAFSGDGTQIVSGSWDGTARVWNVADGKLVSKLDADVRKYNVRDPSGETREEELVGQILGVSFSPDGTRVAGGSSNGVVNIWNTKTWQIESRLQPALLSPITGVAFSGDGRRIVSGSRNAFMRIWDVESATPFRQIGGFHNPVTSVAYSPANSNIAACSYDRRIYLPEITADGFTPNDFHGHTERVDSITFSYDGSRIVSASYDKTIRIWNAQTQQELSRINVPGGPACVAISRDGSLIAAGLHNNLVKLWKASDGEEAQTLRGHAGPVTGIAFSPDGSRLATSSFDKTVKIWSLATTPPRVTTDGTSTAELAWSNKGHTDAPSSVAFSRDGSQIVTGSLDGTARVWDAATGVQVGQPLNADKVPYAVRDPAPGQPKVELKNGQIYGVAFRPDGSQVVAGSVKSVLVWDAKTGRRQSKLEGHAGLVTCIAISSDGSLIASGANDTTVKIWDSKTGQEIQTLEEHSQSITSVAFSPDASRAAGASLGTSIKVWNVETGQVAITLTGHTNRVDDVAFGAGGLTIISCSTDKTLRVWDVKTGEEILKIGEPWGPNCVTVSPDGSQIAAGLQTGFIKVWDVKTGQQMVMVQAHKLGVNSIAFSPDGMRLASTSFDKTVKVWNVKFEKDTAAAPRPAVDGNDNSSKLPDPPKVGPEMTRRPILACNDPQVADYLELTPSQRAEFKRLYDLLMGGQATPEETNTILDESFDMLTLRQKMLWGRLLRANSGSKDVASGLKFDPGLLNRPVSALHDSEIADYLELTKSQRADVTQIYDSLIGSQGSVQVFRAAVQEALGILTTEQRQLWDELVKNNGR